MLINPIGICIERRNAQASARYNDLCSYTYLALQHLSFGYVFHLNKYYIMSKVSVKSKHLFYFMENNKMRTVVMTCPQLRNKRKNKYLAYTKSR